MNVCTHSVIVLQAGGHHSDGDSSAVVEVTVFGHLPLSLVCVVVHFFSECDLNWRLFIFLYIS
jgi:hypothetical protein